jgi:hypothetical protein
MIALDFPQLGEQLLMIGLACDRAPALPLARNSPRADHAESFEALQQRLWFQSPHAAILRNGVQQPQPWQVAVMCVLSTFTGVDAINAVPQWKHRGVPSKLQSAMVKPRGFFLSALAVMAAPLARARCDQSPDGRFVFLNQKATSRNPLIRRPFGNISAPTCTSPTLPAYEG